MKSSRAGQGLYLTGCAPLLSEGEAYLHQKQPGYETRRLRTKLEIMKNENINPRALWPYEDMREIPTP